MLLLFWFYIKPFLCVHSCQVTVMYELRQHALNCTCSLNEHMHRSATTLTSPGALRLWRTGLKLDTQTSLQQHSKLWSTLCFNTCQWSALHFSHAGHNPAQFVSHQVVLAESAQSACAPSPDAWLSLCQASGTELFWITLKIVLWSTFLCFNIWRICSKMQEFIIHFDKSSSGP